MINETRQYVRIGIRFDGKHKHVYRAITRSIGNRRVAPSP
jgi:hypothetical protein